MKIVITVDIPDAANVAVNSYASDEPPLPEAPSDVAPRQIPPEGQCPVHHVQWRTVPAGVSAKTGKPYNEFRACPEQGCNQRPR